MAIIFLQNENHFRIASNDYFMNDISIFPSLEKLAHAL